MNYFDIHSKTKSVLCRGDIDTPAPLISIVIPTFDRLDLLKEAVESALFQRDFKDFEIIVVDNNDSSSHTAKVEQLFDTYNDSRLFYYHNEINIGMTGNWNRCIELARGEWISILHDDDILHPEFLYEISKVLNDNDLVVCGVIVGEKYDLSYADKNVMIKSPIVPVRVVNLVLSNISPAPGIIFRKDKAIMLGGFNDAQYPCADYDFWIRFCLEFKAVRLKKSLAFYRISQNESLKITTRIKIAEKALELQKNLVNKKYNNFIVKQLIPKVGISSLLAHYCDDTKFRDSKDLHDFVTSHRIWFYKRKRLARFTQKCMHLLLICCRLEDQA
jgi:glycosyltransferase involved in cell wall biosynthesis